MISRKFYKHQGCNPSINLIIHAPCENKKKLQEVENHYIEEYAKNMVKINK